MKKLFNKLGAVAVTALMAVPLLASAQSVLFPVQGGTGINSYTTGDLIYSSSGNTLSTLGAGSDGQVLKLSGGVPTWGTDNTGGGGGSGFWASTTNSLVIYPVDTSDVVVINSNATSSSWTGESLEVVGDARVQNLYVENGDLGANIIFDTTSVNPSASTSLFFYEGGLPSMSFGYDGSGSGEANRINFWDIGSSIERFTFTRGGLMGIGSSSPQHALSVVGDMSLSGAIYDGNYETGTNGQILLTTGSIVDWVSTSSLNIAIGDVVGNTDGLPGGSTNLYNQTHTGEVTGATVLTIADNIIQEVNLEVNAPTNGYILAASSSATGGWEWTATTSNNLGLVQFSDLHDAVTLGGSLDYITLSGQVLTRNAIDLTTDTTGTLDETDGGTGLTTYVVGDVLYASGADTLTRLAVGSDGQVLKLSGGVPTWGTDNTGSGGGLSTSTPIADTYVIYGTSVNTVGAEAAFTYDDATDLLTVGDINVNSLNFTFTDAGADAVLGWDDTANVYENLTAGEVLAIVGGVANDFDANGDVTITEADISDFAIGTADITNGVIIAEDLNVDNVPADLDWLQYDSTGGNFVWRSGSELISDIEGSIVDNILLETEIDASSELLALMDDETGTGLLVFGTSPTITSPTLSTFFGTPCSGGQFLQDISDTGAFTCGTPSAGGGGSGFWSTTTDNFAIYPSDVNYNVLIGTTSTSTSVVRIVEGVATNDMIEFVNTDAGSGQMSLQFYKDSATPAFNDNIADFIFYANDDLGNKTEFANILFEVDDETDGTEDGGIVFDVTRAGSVGQSILSLRSTNVYVNPNGNDIDFALWSDSSQISFIYDNGGNEFRICADEACDVEIGRALAVNTVADGDLIPITVLASTTDSAVRVYENVGGEWFEIGVNATGEMIFADEAGTPTLTLREDGGITGGSGTINNFSGVISTSADVFTIYDQLGNEIAEFVKGTGTGANEFRFLSSATGNAIEMISDGSDTNIDLQISTKGSGKIIFNDIIDIPSGTAPTVDAEGEMALDTTDNQLLLGDSGGTSRVFARAEHKLFSFTLASTSIEFVNGGIIPLPPEKDGFEITQFRCYVSGGTSIVVNVSDGTNDTETISCGTTLTSDTDVTTNDTFTAGELAEIQIGTITGTPDYLTFTAYGHITVE